MTQRAQQQQASSTSADSPPRDHALQQVHDAVVACRQCADLREYCSDVARKKRRAYIDWEYWGKPVPGFGDPQAKILILGLAPAAHGANRTGRMFTGDRSGDFLYAALHRAGLANQPNSAHRTDGLELQNVYITAPLRCAPPANRPTAEQLANCRQYLHDELDLLQPRVIICLGGIAWKSALTLLRERGYDIPVPQPKFAHGTEAVMRGIREQGAGNRTEDDVCERTSAAGAQLPAPSIITLLGCYHVSQQNTFTGRLTEPMIDAVLERAKRIAAA